MHVLHVIAYFAPAFRYGGPPRSVLSLCQHLRGIGVDARVLTTTADGPHEVPDGIVRTGSYDGVPTRYLPRAFPRRFFGASGLFRALDEELSSCDVAHLHGLWNIPVVTAGLVARRKRVPYLVSPRGMIQPAAIRRRRGGKRFAFRVLERRNLAAAALLHATSDEEAEELRRLGLGERVFVSPNGVALPPVPPRPGEFRRKWNIPPEAPLVAFLGRVHPVKRIDLLLEAVSQIRAELPEIRLAIAGPDEGGHTDDLQRRFRHVGQNVIWTGPLGQEEKWGLLGDATVSAVCSDTESFGLSVVEAMAAGTPVVVTKTCPWEEIERRRCGFWVDQSPPAIAAALCTIVSNPDAAREMGDRASELARERYGWGPIAADMAARYAEVTASRRSGGMITPAELPTIVSRPNGAAPA